CQHYISDPFTF
nr:immunoglobulin light chain junction region [Macaca mulatta]MOW33708.1 immunoglobulin light chain junction region [Macaca mulatta]MOW33726.1 immunoglobulin light chain junction region [Macaca mulatta]MOW33731.1 immunoglobulin light chain junction region [Macaca mulatta]MOW33737.1 immunoglobulin light chain junction region [Macaca mulatta]